MLKSKEIKEYWESMHPCLSTGYSHPLISLWFHWGKKEKKEKKATFSNRTQIIADVVKSFHHPVRKGRAGDYYGHTCCAKLSSLEGLQSKNFHFSLSQWVLSRKLLSIGQAHHPSTSQQSRGKWALPQAEQKVESRRQTPILDVSDLGRQREDFFWKLRNAFASAWFLWI